MSANRRARPSEPVQDPLPIVAGQIDARFEKADKYQGKADEHRISAGLLLMSAKERVRAGEPGHTNWRRWVEANIERSYRDANRCIALVKTPDPVTAHQAYKKKDREAKSLKRQEKNGPDVCPTSERHDLEDMILTAFDALPKERRGPMVATLARQIGWDAFARPEFLDRGR